ncbi:tyrosine-type recombinase/integrase [Nakamurella endophytica]|uniref:Site-specific integrase n=1 Tax=Nakamurella endophytica TaxID=1748367 RepID=A0A917WLU8_9ACTN|nr:site-specific integrase [Nakamurella endophytica]GGM12956.1 hypothetical protein GCM10011594_36090 [Nakamurella endophytica]
MAYILDLWTQPGANGRRVKSARHGQGKRWLARWDEGGQRRSKAFDTRDAATAHLAQIDVDQRAGLHVLTTGMTVGEYGDRWIGLQLHQRASSTQQMETRWRLHIRPALGELRLADVTRAHVQDAVAGWARTLAPATVSVTYGYLASMMKAAVLDRLLRESPCRGVKLPRLEVDKVVPLSVAQVHTIAERIGRRYRGMVLLGAATGMRSGELRGLTVDRLRFADGLLRIRIDRQLVSTEPKWGPPKTERSDRTVTVGEQTAGMLRRHMAEVPPHQSGLIFTGREGGPLARTSAATAWNLATEGMGLPGRSGLHMLRHHHASLLIAAGLSVTAVADRLGHKDSTETLQTYAHLWEDDEDRARVAVEGRLWALVGPDGETVQPTDSQQRLRVVAP